MSAPEEPALGPVDIVVIGYPAGAPRSGEAVPIVLDLAERGIIRVLDVMFIVKEEDGRFYGFEGQELSERGFEAFHEFEGASSGILGEEDVATAAEGLQPGDAAVMIVYENRWAAPFIDAVHRNGGRLLAAERVSAEDLMAVLEAA